MVVHRPLQTTCFAGELHWCVARAERLFGANLHLRGDGVGAELHDL
jgi:hypothetical protein